MHTLRDIISAIDSVIGSVMGSIDSMIGSVIGFSDRPRPTVGPLAPTGRSLGAPSSGRVSLKNRNKYY